MPKYQLYSCLGSGNCYKPWLALHQLSLPYDLHLIDVLTGEQKSPEFVSVNPLGVVPFLKTEKGSSIGESGAMLWHICDDTFLMPKSAEQRAEALQWMFFEQSKLEPFISPARFFTTIVPDAAEARADDILQWQTQAIPGLTHLDTHLSDRRFMLGVDYSLADIAVYGYTHVLEEAGLTLGDFPNVAAWMDNVAQTKGFQPLSALGATSNLGATSKSIAA